MHRTPSALLIVLLCCGGALADQVCNDRIDFNTPNSRFVDNGDGTVMDLRTSLTWQRCPLGFDFVDGDFAESTAGDECVVGEEPTTFDWQDALLAAEALNAGGFAGHSDWRLPNEKELASIVETRCFNPAINAAIFPATPSDEFWSGSQDVDSDSLAVYVDFSAGGKSVHTLASVLYVRLVREVPRQP